MGVEFGEAVKQVRPEIGFDQYEKIGLYFFEKKINHRKKIQRRINQTITVRPYNLLGDLISAHRGGRKNYGRRFMFVLVKLLHQMAGGGHLANGKGMYPHG